jgi:hypothetical protein
VAVVPLLPQELRGTDGTVPASFDWLIEEQFGEIVPASAS